MEQARDRILNAAEARLLAGGPAALVLDAIAADAGVSKGGLLYHFRSQAGAGGGAVRAHVRALRSAAPGPVRRRPGAHWSLDPRLPGLHSHAEGKPADSSAQLMAGILASVGRDEDHLETIRSHFARWHRRLESDGIDLRSATIVRLAADGLWLSALLGLDRLEDELGAETLAALRGLTEAP